MNRREVIAVTLAAVAIAAVWAWRVQTSERSTSSMARAEASASYYPDDAVAYAWLTLAPSGDQAEDMMNLVEGFYEFEGIREVVSAAEEMLLAATGSDFEDFGAWMGTEMSAAAFDLGDGEFGVAATVGVGDREAADEFLMSWIEQRESQGSASFERYMVGDDAIWVGDGNEWMGEEAYARVGDLLMFATDRDLLGDVLDRVGGANPRTLATDRKFLEARSAAPDRRFASVYLDYGRMSGLMGSGSGVGVCSGELFAAPDWLMASAGRVDRGLVIDLVTPDVTSWWTDTSGDATAAVVPADALGFVSIGFDPDIDHWREVLGECEIAALLPDGELFGRPLDENGTRLDDGATLADALDLVLGIVDGGVGLDLEEDLFDHLSGELVVMARGSDMGADSVEGAAVVSYRFGREDTLAETLDTLVGRIAPLGAAAKEVDVGAENAGWMIEGRQPFSFGYVLHDGYLTFGTTVEALEAIVAVQGGERDRLADTDEYRRTVGHISYAPQLLAYLDLERIIGKLDLDDMGFDNGLYEVLSEGMSAVAIGVGIDGDYSRATFVLSLFPSNDPITARN